MVQLTWLSEAVEGALSVAEKRARLLGQKSDEQKLRFWSALSKILQRSRRLNETEEETLKRLADTLTGVEGLSYESAACLLFMLAASSVASTQNQGGLSDAAVTQE